MTDGADPAAALQREAKGAVRIKQSDAMSREAGTVTIL